MTPADRPTTLIVSGDFVKTGGMDRANYALADYLARRGDPVRLVAYQAADDLLARPNVSIRRVAKPAGSYTLGRPLLDRAGRSEASQVARAGGRTVVNGGNCRWGGGVNWVHHINVLDAPAAGASGLAAIKARVDYRLHVRAERSAIAVAGRVVTTCLKNRDDLVRLFGLDPDRVAVVYYGADPDAFRPPLPGERESTRAALGWDVDRPVFLFVGGLGADRRKGFDTLFAAWSTLCRDPDWTADLAVVGDGAERPTWESKATAAGLANRVRFLGFRRDVPALFRAADAHVLPSRYEGYSLVTQEALCSGLPAFVTGSAGIAERFEGGLADALLIPDPDDADALARRLRDWPSRSGSLRPALDDLSARLRAFTWDDMAARLVEIVSSPDPSIG